MDWKFNDGGRDAAGYRGRTGDCAVRAVAIATGLPYQEVYDALQAEIRAQHRLKDRAQSVRNGVPNKVLRKYLSKMGWSFTPTMQIGSGCKVHLRSEELPKGRLIASVSRHIVAVIDGVIHDTYDCSRDGTRCVYGYWQRRPDEIGLSQCEAFTRMQHGIDGGVQV